MPENSGSLEAIWRSLYF